MGLNCRLGPVNIMVKGGTRVSFDFNNSDEKTIQDLLSQLKGKPLKINVWVDEDKEEQESNMISQPQLNLIYQLLKNITFELNGEITEGNLKEVRQEAQKRIDQEDLSLSKSICTKATATELINELMAMVLEYNVPTAVNILEFMQSQDEATIENYVRGMLKIKKCTICGDKGEVHHWDAIGMGRDRKTVDDSSLRQIALCRIHHTEAETIGKNSFKQKYHIWGVYVT